VRSRALIYIEVSQQTQSVRLQVQRDASSPRSSLGKYSYKRRHGDQEVFGEWVSVNVMAPRGRVADKRSSYRFSSDLGNRGKVPLVLGTSQRWSRSRLSFHNSEIGAEVREEDKNLD
jgi:hypothetical protein